MAKLPSLNFKKVVMAFQFLGWEVVRQSSSHIILVQEGRSVTLSVPAHKSVAKGTLRSLIRSAGLTVSEFMDAVK